MTQKGRHEDQKCELVAVLLIQSVFPVICFHLIVFEALPIASDNPFPVGLVVGLVIAENIVLAIVISCVCIRRKNKGNIRLQLA